MSKFKWVIWGSLFSLVLFFSIYFLIHVKVVNNVGPVVLMLGKMDVSKLGIFFSDIKNVIITSLIVGFLLGLLTGTKSKN